MTSAKKNERPCLPCCLIVCQNFLQGHSKVFSMASCSYSHSFWFHFHWRCRPRPFGTYLLSLSYLVDAWTGTDDLTITISICLHNPGCEHALGPWVSPRLNGPQKNLHRFSVGLSIAQTFPSSSSISCSGLSSSFLHYLNKPLGGYKTNWHKLTCKQPPVLWEKSIPGKVSIFTSTGQGEFIPRVAAVHRSEPSYTVSSWHGTTWEVVNHLQRSACQGPRLQLFAQLTILQTSTPNLTGGAPTQYHYNS